MSGSPAPDGVPAPASTGRVSVHAGAGAQPGGTGVSRRRLLGAGTALGAGAVVAITGCGAPEAPLKRFGTDFTQAANYNQGRNYRHHGTIFNRGAEVKGIVIHWWGEPAGQTHQGIVDYLTSANSRSSSAHYVVSQSRVSQLVGLNDTAWHAGVYDVNAESIGIECRPEMDAATWRNVVSLVSKLHGAYGPLWLEPHKSFTDTTCPGVYSERIDDLKVIAAGSRTDIPQAPDYR
ncbi:MAG: peptidoglycan recognition family protein [Acidipropionibacterium acidipropionici]|jgi:N-acetylmuramoyl-L-alanine amidase|nr:peptidoglycan recognition family protein [Acidipropionibacterium acidipropionici]AZP36905.1 N-acetylmuramoyl-L-alanine amidase [Acidipropionibacterium acidipropionici]